MNRKLIASTFLIVFALASASDAHWRRPSTRPTAAQGVVKIPCDPSIRKIEDCPDVGCSNERAFDPNLNKQKNIRRSNQPVEDWAFADLARLDDPVTGFSEGETREKLALMGEGKKIRVVAFAVEVRKGSAESCNCGLTRVRDTDNHIVLIDPADRSPSLADEHQSLTAEFTPRVRLTHPNLSRVRLRPLILDARPQALKVRITGLVMFDSFHSLHQPVPKGRHNNWEIHPVLHLEYCPKGKVCTKDSNANWKDLEQ